MKKAARIIGCAVTLLLTACLLFSLTELTELKDENEARKILEKAGYTEEQIMKPREIKGFTDLEKLTGKKKLDALLKDVILKPPGKPKLAPESDKRPEWNSAKADFDDLDKEAIPF